MPLPIGLVYDAAGHVILDPDTAIQGALRHLFATFEAAGSATAVVKAFRAAGLTFPWRHRKGPRKGEVDWQPLRHSTVLRVLHNPRYAGAFTYGRHREQLLPGGKRASITLPREEWISFIPGAHPGYITLDQWEANIARLAANAAAHGRDRAAGPPREGPALLQGIIICGRCGGRMTIRYHARGGKDLPTYLCQRDGIDNARPICAAIPGHTLDEHDRPAAHRHPHPAGRRGRPHGLRRTRSTAPPTPTRCAPPTSSAPATTPTWPAAATSPSTPPTGSSPTPSKPTGTPPCAPSTTPRPPTTRPATSTTAQLTDAQKARIAQLVTDLPAHLERPRHPDARAQAHRPAAAHRRHRDPHQRHHHRARPPGRRPAPHPHPAGPRPAWKIRQTKASTIAEIDKLLDHHTCAEIAAILRSRGLANGEGRPVQPHHGGARHPHLPATQPPPAAARRRPDPAQPDGRSSSACPPAPSRSGTTPELSAGSGITTKAKSSTTRPAPTRQPATKDAGTTPCDLHERHLAAESLRRGAVCNPRFRSGRLRRAGENPDAFRGKNGVEGAGELARAVPDQELD